MRRKTKKRLKNAAFLVCASALAFVSGFTGARMGSVSNFTLGEKIEETEAVAAVISAPEPIKNTRPMFLGVYIDQTESGVLVTSIIRNTLAETFDIREGDFIRSANGRQINFMRDISNELRRTTAEGSLELLIERNGEFLIKHISHKEFDF